ADSITTQLSMPLRLDELWKLPRGHRAYREKRPKRPRQLQKLNAKAGIRYMLMAETAMPLVLP
ncbi:MAG: hypothetical protein NTZ94_03205, partial [Verrucomicrobia bacterium]|nr:hypothetical protein [Verrucomicrobiota bacterium]